MTEKFYKDLDGLDVPTPPTAAVAALAERFPDWRALDVAWQFCAGPELFGPEPTAEGPAQEDWARCFGCVRAVALHREETTICLGLRRVGELNGQPLMMPIYKPYVFYVGRCECGRILWAKPREDTKDSKEG